MPQHLNAHDTPGDVLLRLDLGEIVVTVDPETQHPNIRLEPIDTQDPIARRAIDNATIERNQRGPSSLDVIIGEDPQSAHGGTTMISTFRDGRGTVINQVAGNIHGGTIMTGAVIGSVNVHSGGMTIQSGGGQVIVNGQVITPGPAAPASRGVRALLTVDHHSTIRITAGMATVRTTSPAGVSIKDLDILLDHGSLDVHDAQVVHASTDTASIRAHADNIDASTDTGSIALHQGRNAKARTETGNITIAEFEKVDARSDTGNISLSNCDEVDARSDTGNLRCDYPLATADMRTDTGNITIRCTTNARINARSDTGNIDYVVAANTRIHARSKVGNIRRTVTGS